MTKFPPISVHNLGDYLREQRHSAELSLRQLSEVAGISNPYLSQIERGLKKPSAEILQALAKALRISAESLYVRAGFLEERTDLAEAARVDVQAAVLADPALSNRQRAVLLDVYESFVGEPAPRTPSRARRSTKATKPAEATKATRPTKPRPAKTPAHHSPDPALNTTKEN
ncbi:MAG: helix-turn-helix transcriptional regulator [Phycicoccus sp.]|nr:helix-turn-helix transcriptional regulator [Phycicoccus sp.]